MNEPKRSGAFELREADPFPVGKRDFRKQMSKEFRVNLDLYMEREKLSAADLVRENNKRMDGNPEWMELRPWHITRYRSGQAPKIHHLRQIAELLGVTPHDLIPSYEGPTVSGGSRMGMKDVGDGKSLVDFSAVIDTRIARKIMVLLNSDPEEIA